MDARTGPRDDGSSRSLTKWRLISLLVLFDILLVVVVVLSFQGPELIEEEVILRQTREVYDVQMREQVITHTRVITRILPYGAQR
jgi:hypothetical protein